MVAPTDRVVTKYKGDQDLPWFYAFRDWLAQDDTRRVESFLARKNYADWCERRGLEPRSKNGFGYLITFVRIHREYLSGQRYYTARKKEERQEDGAQ